MSEPFLGEIKITAFNFAPKGWALCNGQTYPISGNEALFSLMGTTYGGNGQSTFALPNLQGRVSVGMGSGFSGSYTLGQNGGEENHTLTSAEMPAHTHFVSADNKAGDATRSIPIASKPAFTAPTLAYSPGGQNMVAMHVSMVTILGGSQPHTNMQPYLTLNFCIALSGIFPSR